MSIGDQDQDIRTTTSGISSDEKMDVAVHLACDVVVGNGLPGYKEPTSETSSDATENHYHVALHLVCNVILDATKRCMKL